ncbi:SgcJ/EcaC family oxidoreductase [Scopulibacillus cellulosilyticus]|uniref:SgcJ/EcaC family oxidoreductase n=1 Tax=Scopulibacillus cellulosilyticus TaxID=2665665 RepID=A0ABW2PXV2_9BACL
MVKEKDTVALKALFKNLAEAWNNADGEAYGQCFTNDADYVTFNGTHLKGRKEIAKVHQWLFNGPLNGSKMSYDGMHDFSPRYITPDVAIIHGKGEVSLPESQDPGDRLSINTNVVVKEGGKWFITAFHNCRVQSFQKS